MKNKNLFKWEDCTIENIRASGPGGQHKNRRETGIRLTHNPTGLVVTAVEQRERFRNLENAKKRMQKALERFYHRDPKRIPTHSPNWANEQRLETKRKKSQKKKIRKKPHLDKGQGFTSDL
jgi:protein subunit release factor B